jgi:ABC-type phosphate transport system ATPase subunit
VYIEICLLVLIYKKDFDIFVERLFKELNLWEEVKGRMKNLATTLSVGQKQRSSIV